MSETATLTRLPGRVADGGDDLGGRRWRRHAFLLGAASAIAARVAADASAAILAQPVRRAAAMAQSADGRRPPAGRDRTRARSPRCTPPSRCSASPGCSASGSSCRRSRSCSAGRRSPRVALGVVRCAPARRAAAVRRAPRRQRRRARAALGRVLRRDPGRRRVAIGLLGFASFPLFVLIARARCCSGGAGRGREAATALLVTRRARAARAGVLAREPHGAGPRVGRSCPASRSRCWPCCNRRWRRDAPAVDIAFWQNAFAALCAAAVRVVAGRRGAGAHRRARDRAAPRAGPRLHGARAHAVHRRARAPCRRTRRASSPRWSPSTASRWRCCCWARCPGARTLAGGALIVGAAIVASRRARSLIRSHRIGSSARMAASRRRRA